MLTAEFQSADCGCLNSYGCLIPRFFCGPFLTEISQEDTFEKGWGEKEREYEDENVKDRGRELRQTLFFCYRKFKFLLFTLTVKMDKGVMMTTWVSEGAAEETHSNRGQEA